MLLLTLQRYKKKYKYILFFSILCYFYAISLVVLWKKAKNNQRTGLGNAKKTENGHRLQGNP